MRWINRRPRHAAWLAMGPFLVLAVVYLIASELRLAENPADKLIPAPGSILSALQGLALEADSRTGDYLLWQDTGASLGRLALGVSIATAIALFAGMAIGMLPVAGATLDAFVTAVSMIPALAILPILFIVFGVGEVAKVALITLGVLPFMIRDLAQRVREIPEEQWIKGQSLGASSLQLALRVVLPQVLPRLLASVRMSLGPAWLFLISAEAISATSGLGYRIFLMRRYLAMDVILPYVAWITLLAFSLDFALREVQRRRYAWLGAEAR
jgi:NitT/TauT family transport system permease protein